MALSALISSVATSFARTSGLAELQFFDTAVDGVANVSQMMVYEGSEWKLSITFPATASIAPV
jgi:hypothetical protein